MQDSLLHQIESRIADRSLRIGIVGMGYVGLPLMLAATGAGFSVLGFDVDAPKVAGLNEGRSPLAHVGDARIAAARAKGRFEATADLSRLGSVDAVLVCVPTPLGVHREPDLSFVVQTTRDIAACLRGGQVIVLESTTWPGTTREVMKPILEATGLRSGADFLLGYSPEREDPGNPDFSTSIIPKIVGGDGVRAMEVCRALYASFVAEVVPVASLEIAEAAKLTENIFRAVNIALVNELKLVLSKLGIDVHAVIDAASTKPFGYMAFRPGPGLGGHCIPIDPFYLDWKAREVGARTRFIELAGEINRAMPQWVVDRVAEAIDRRHGKGLSRAQILLIGVAYKKNVDDVRESPAFAIWELLEARGAEILYHDPHVPVIPTTREHGRLAGRRSTALGDAVLAGVDAAVIVTDHDSVDFEALAGRVSLLIDTRGRLRDDGRVVQA